ncbi:response regulator transcription factor [Caminibacter mediatlanticus TB-2]|uniref:Response regulator transcription factor n=1 Tax=Caminibacter mediatlanticus TB-2 TaxID=391592 RepID=A0ABX5V8S4_9BACT|nr:response regulator transcription factor [Caminibacter mediatlanticus]QCT94369.1 response regulator transcription factor [Caminibacter mediatlanticus TB-2]
MKILVVEDDIFIGESIKDYFELQGNRVDYYSSPLKALEEIYPSNYDIFLIDINMPEMNGYEFYNELKNYASDVPVIFITAYSDIEHIEKAFDLGAADYIKKPFELKELELRVKRLVFKKTNCVEITENYKFDLGKLKLFYKNKEVDLTQNEKYFLELLVKNIGQVVDTTTLRDYVWDGKDICNNTIRTHVKKLRSKLKENFIKNVRGSGYKIEKQ